MVELILVALAALFGPEIIKFLAPEKPVKQSDPDPEINEPCSTIIYKPLNPVGNQGDSFLPKGYCYSGDASYFDDKPHTTGDPYAQKQAEKFIAKQKEESKIAEMKNIVLILANDTATEIETAVVDETDNTVVFPDPIPPDAPVATSATGVDDATFTANWGAVAGATGYYLDVATDSGFLAFVTGYENRDVGNVLTLTLSGIANTTYFYRVRSHNATKTSSNSNTITLSTVLMDIDGNTYSQVTIGNQIWLQQNLKATKYADGSAISNLTLDADWIADTDGAYCYYNNDEATYKATYGALYNWWALKFSDWYLPSNSELEQVRLNLKVFGVGGLGNGWYWSSSELDFDSAYQINFTSGMNSSDTKNVPASVRQIRSFTAAVGAYALRDTGPAGGLVFYTDGAGNYLECATSDLSASQAWSDVTATLIGTTGTAIGTGAANTLAIINQPGHTASAALLCNTYAVGDRLAYLERNGVQVVGWRIPTQTDFVTLSTGLDGGGPVTFPTAGGKMKEIGTTVWDAPNTGATNATGFSAPGTGYRHETGPFINQKITSYLGSSTLTTPTTYKVLTLSNSNDNTVVSSLDFIKGIAIRLVKDV